MLSDGGTKDYLSHEPRVVPTRLTALKGRNRVSLLWKMGATWWSWLEKQAFGPLGKEASALLRPGKGALVLPGPPADSLERWSRQDPQCSHTSSSRDEEDRG